MRILQLHIAAEDQVVVRELQGDHLVEDHRRVSVLDTADQHHWNYLQTRTLAHILNASTVLWEHLPDMQRNLYACLYFTNSTDAVWRGVLYEHMTQLLRAWRHGCDPRHREYTLDERQDPKVYPVRRRLSQ